MQIAGKFFTDVSIIAAILTDRTQIKNNTTGKIQYNIKSNDDELNSQEITLKMSKKN